VNLRAAAFLADENIHRDVVTHLRSLGLEVSHVSEIGLSGANDREILRQAVAENRIILTHDADFGTLVFAGAEPFVGIVYLRPGHISSTFVIGTLETLFRRELDLEPPFIVVAERRQQLVTIRIRRL